MIPRPAYLVTRKGLYIASSSKLEFLELGNGLLLCVVNQHKRRTNELVMIKVNCRESENDNVLTGEKLN